MSFRKNMLAGVGAIGLLGAPAPAFADISFGELEDALTDFGEDFFTILVQILLTGAELPASLVWLVEDAITGGQVSALPITPAESVEYAAERAIDRIERVNVTNEIIGSAAASVAEQTTLMATLSAANAASPVSIASLQQIGNAAQIANTTTDAAMIQFMGAQMSMQADQAYHEETVRVLAMAQQEAWVGPVVGGGLTAGTLQPY